MQSFLNLIEMRLSGPPKNLGLVTRSCRYARAVEGAATIFSALRGWDIRAIREDRNESFAGEVGVR